MNANFGDFVREVENESTPAERRELDAARARFKLGARVLQRRRAAGFTQQQLAAASGIGQADISRIERGQSNPTAETLQALAGPLGVTLDLVAYVPAHAEERDDLAGIATDQSAPPLSVAETRAAIDRTRRPYIPST
jgi:transcriptional regulator with XRE-family HTH domain